MQMNELIYMMQKSQNPQQFLLNYLTQNAPNNPIGQNILQLAQTGNTAEIEKIARNLAQAKGIDYDKEFSAFKQMLMR